MKKLICGLLLSIILLTSIPVCTNAAPRGYKVIKLTKKNAKKYFTFKKVKNKDTFGDYNGYGFALCSKLRKKGYFIYSDVYGTDFALKVSYKERYKEKIKKRWYKHSRKNTVTINGCESIGGGWKNCNYKYGKISNIKFKKAKGTLVLVEPSNVIAIKKDPEYDVYNIILKYPYRPYTRYDRPYTFYEDHWDSEKGKYVVDYYYIQRSSRDLYLY